MEFKHIIWDWNGTLLDDRWLCVESINKSLKKRNLPEIDEEKYRDIFCFPVENYYKKLGFDFEQEPFTVSGTEFIANYNSRFHDPRLQEGVLDILNMINHRDISQSVLSAGKQEFVRDWVKFHGLQKFFIKVLGIHDHYAAGKTELGKMWIQQLKFPPENVLLIGDTIHDWEVSAAMGVECLLIAHGHTSMKRLQDTGKTVFKNLQELKEYLFKTLPLHTSVSA